MTLNNRRLYNTLFRRIPRSSFLVVLIQINSARDKQVLIAAIWPPSVQLLVQFRIWPAGGAAAHEAQHKTRQQRQQQ